MKRKIIILLLRSGVVFLTVADVFKLICRVEEWIIPSALGCICSFIGGVFCECLSIMKEEKEEEKIIDFERYNKNMKPKLIGQCVIAGIVVGIVVAFIEGVILDKTWVVHSITSIWAFGMGCIPYEKKMLQKKK